MNSGALDDRDPDFIRRHLRGFERLIDAWFAPEVDGLERVPDGRALIVGTHNGGNMAPDMLCLMAAFWRRFGPERPAYGLAHDQVFRVPMLGRLLSRLGAVPAGQERARALLERDATVLVYPGGDVDAFKPFRERHTVKFGGRTGFVRTALATGAPIVPVVSVGAHETVRVLGDGRGLARALGLKRWTRIEVLPVMLCLPWGVFLGPLEGHLPMPSKIRLRVLPPMKLAHPPSAAGDDALVRALAEQVRSTMQAALDELAREPHGVRARLDELLRP